MPAVDLNLDLGELPNEPAELYALATVVNVACGGHAGDVKSMARAVSFALARGAKIAAHPSYPDREGFGRVKLELPPEAIAETVRSQCAALASIASKMGARVGRVKAHGALYHAAQGDASIARAVIDGATDALGRDVIVMGPPSGALADEAHARSLAYEREGFADRGLRDDGSLVPRGEPGALLDDPRACSKQALALAGSGGVETICVHGDGPRALDVARAVRAALEGAGLLVVWA